MKKQLSQADLLIPCEDNNQDAALRIYNNEGKILYYSSTRVGGVKKADQGYIVKDVDQFVGMKYELKLLETKKVLEGIVEPGNSNSKKSD